MARLAPGHADSMHYYYLDHVINYHGVGKGRPRPIQAHCGYLGNEKSDTLAKKDPITQPCDFSQAADSQGYLGRGNKKENKTYELNGDTQLT